MPDSRRPGDGEGVLHAAAEDVRDGQAEGFVQGVGIGLAGVEFFHDGEAVVPGDCRIGGFVQDVGASKA